MNAGPIILVSILCILPLLMAALGFAVGHRVGKLGWQSFKIERKERTTNGTRILRSH